MKIIKFVAVLVLLISPTFAIEPPTFSHQSGFYPEPFDLTISHPDKSATIYYTLDGSDPDPENLNGKTFRYKNSYAQPPATEPIGEFLYLEYKTHKYSKLIKIVDRTYEPDRISQISTTFDENPKYLPKPTIEVDPTISNKIYKQLNKAIGKINKSLNRLTKNIKKHILRKENVKLGEKIYIKEFVLTGKKKYLYKGTSIKAIAVSDQEISKVVSKVFFIGDQKQFSLPIINITVPEKELFDYDEGIFVAGVDYDEWIKKDIENKKANGGSPANWKRKSDKTDKIPAIATFVNSSQSFDISVDIRGHGGWSRANRSKSIRVYPKQKELKKADVRIFDDEKFYSYRLNLRNAGNKFGSNYIQDAVVHKIAEGLGIGTQRFAPQIVFINGEYNGILNARDRKDEHYIKHTFGLPDKNIDLLKRKHIADHGDDVAYKQMLGEWENTQDKTTSEFYKRVSSQIDVKSFIDYFALSIYYARTDWPGNNIAYWRYKGESDQTNKYTDGKWRWLLYDTDESFSINHPTLLYALGKHDKPRKHDPWASFILNSLMENPRFRENFIIRFSDLINSWFLPSRASRIVESLEKTLENEMPRHIERWKSPSSVEAWRNSVNAIKNASKDRPKYQWQHLKEFFDLGDLHDTKIELNIPNSAVVELNTLTLDDAKPDQPKVTDVDLSMPFEGKYFEDIPIKLKVIPKKGYRFVRWKGVPADQANSPEISIKPTQNLAIKAVMEAR